MATNPFEDQALAASWAANAERRARGMGPATETMLDRAGVGRGSRVLDVGAGTGESSLLAAARVGGDGQVLLTDPSEAMLEVARAAVEASGFRNVEVRRLAAGEPLDGTFDAVIGRLSLQFIPQLADGLQWMRAHLRPGGRVSALVGTTWQEQPLISIPFRALEAVGHPPVEGSPILVPFSLGDPDRLTADLVRAGFGEVRTERVPARSSFTGPEEAWSIVQSMAQTKRALESLPESRHAAYVEHLRIFTAALGTSGPIEVSGDLLLVSGMNPGSTV